MANRHSKVRRPARVPREGGVRMQARQSLMRGDWDDMPSTMSARSMRRPVIN